MCGYKLHLNSHGRGKGLAIYSKEDLFQHVFDINKPNLQITKMSTEQTDIIIVYRSQEENFRSVKNDIEPLINLNKTTLIVGDLNYCAKSGRNELSEYFQETKFTQLVTEATHIKGAVLDHVQFRGNQDSTPFVEGYPAYYTYDDHDIITVLLEE